MKSIRDLVAYYNTETRRDARYDVVEHLLVRLGELGDVSLSQVARDTYVDKSTISRLVRRFGFTGYDEFVSESQRYVHQDFSVTLRVDRDDELALASDPDGYIGRYVDEVCDALQQLKDTLSMAEVDELVSEMMRFDTSIFATDQPLSLARDMQVALLAAGKLVHVGETKAKRRQIADEMGTESLAIFLSNYGRYVEGNRAMIEGMRQCGVRTWLITLCYDGPNVLLFDHVTRLSNDSYSPVGIYPMRAFVEVLVRRVLVSASSTH